MAPADQKKCCDNKAAAGTYDPACPIGDACATWPPQHRSECCKAKEDAGQSDKACATDKMGGDCSSWPPADQPFCCDLKAEQGVFDKACPEPEVCTFPCADSCIHSLPK